MTLHQAAFAVWAGATGLHVLARLVPTLQLTVRVGSIVFALGHAGSWTALFFVAG